MKTSNFIFVILCSLVLFTSCAKEEFTQVPSEGYFVIEQDTDGDIYIRSTAPAPNKGYKSYQCRTATGLVVEIEDPFCGTPKRMNITEIMYVSGRKENGSAIFKTYSPVLGDAIFVNEVYYDESKKFHDEMLQLSILTENEMKI